MSLRIKILLVIMGCVLGAGFFYLRALSRRIFFEAPKQAEETIRARLHEAAFEPTAGPQKSALLFFPSLNDDRLVAEIRPITWAENDADKVRQIILALIEGPRQAPSPSVATVQQSLSRPLPPATNVRAVFLVSDGTAYVDFASDVLTSPAATAAPGSPGVLTPGIATESLAIYSVVDSITTNVPAVKKVKFLVQGQEVETLDGHADLTEAYAPDPSRIQASSPKL